MDAKRSAAPVSLGNQRDAVAARRLCDELAHCCSLKELNVMVAAVSGLISMMPPEAQTMILASVQGRVTHKEIEQLPIDPKDAAVIDKIVNGAT